MTLGEMLSNTARKYPRRTALVFEGRKYSYRELDELAEGFAAGLAGLGVRPGGHVGILLGNCPEFVAGYFGIAKSGAAAVPLNTFLAVPELEYILKDAGIGVLVSSPEFSDKIPEIRKSSESLKYIVCATGKMDGAVPMADVVVKGGQGPGATGGSEPAAILYTSGTTGRPKGAILTHSNLLSNAASCASAFKVTGSDRFLLFLPMFHSFAFLVCMLLPLSVGARVTILTSVKPFSRVTKGIVFGRTTLFVAIPPIYNLLSMKKFPWIVLKLLSLRMCVSGAAPLAGDVLARFDANFPFPLLEGYGLTEASPVVCCNPLEGIRKQGSVGPPIPGVEVKIVDGQDRELPAGEVGEVIVRGPNVMKGYLGNEAATKDTIRGGWLFTGDMGRLDDAGYLYIVDRLKDLILVHGMNVYPREVEEALHQHPAVKEAAVIGVLDPGHTEFPKAFITLADGMKATEKELKEFLRERLASYKVPRQIAFMDALPMTPTGKVMKKALKCV